MNDFCVIRKIYWCVVGAVWRLQRAGNNRATHKHREESTHNSGGFLVEHVCSVCFFECCWCCASRTRGAAKQYVTTLQAQCMKIAPQKLIKSNPLQASPAANIVQPSPSLNRGVPSKQRALLCTCSRPSSERRVAKDESVVAACQGLPS